jgi:hypothetical protein
MIDGRMSLLSLQRKWSCRQRIRISKVEYSVYATSIAEPRDFYAASALATGRKFYAAPAPTLQFKK